MAQYSIELAGPHNDSVIFPPTQQRLRGAWDFANVAHLNKVTGPEGDWLRDISIRVRRIPGMVIVIDDSKKKAGIIDPLGLKEHEETMKTMNAIFKAHGKPFDSNGAKPHDAIEMDLDFDGVKLWLYWMRRLLNGKLAVMCDGSPELPSLEQIDKLPGKRLRDPMNTYEQTDDSPVRHGQYGLYPFTAEVPIPKGKEAATA